MFNYFGPQLKKEDISKCLNPINANDYYKTIRNQFEKFFKLPFCALSHEILERYVEVTEKIHMDVVPFSMKILEKLLNPLKLAKKSYSLGDYFLTVASCGFAGEMLAILSWKIGKAKLNGNTMTVKDEELLFGREFERLGQEQRLKILKALRLISDEQFGNFNDLRKIRNFYLHSFNKSNNRTGKADSLKATMKAFSLFRSITPRINELINVK